MAQTSDGGEHDHVAVGRSGIGGELLDFAPLEKTHLLRIAPRRLDAEDALVYEMPALLGVREQLLEQTQGQFGLTWRAFGERCDVVFDRSGADLVEGEALERVKVLHDLACPLQC
ncbi:MAG TPA: hypothetical protein VF091_10245 [Gaiellaceae bacterium]